MEVADWVFPSSGHPILRSYFVRQDTYRPVGVEH